MDLRQRDLQVFADGAGVFLQRGGGGHRPAAFHPCHRRLGGAHAFGHVLLRQLGACTGLDEFAGKRELRLQPVVFRPDFRILQSLFFEAVEGFHDTSLARKSAISISWRGVLFVFLTKVRSTTTRRSLAVT